MACFHDRFAGSCFRPGKFPREFPEFVGLNLRFSPYELYFLARPMKPTHQPTRLPHPLHGTSALNLTQPPVHSEEATAPSPCLPTLAASQPPRPSCADRRRRAAVHSAVPQPPRRTGTLGTLRRQLAGAAGHEQAACRAACCRYLRRACVGCCCRAQLHSLPAASPLATSWLLLVLLEFFILIQTCAVVLPAAND